METIRYLRRSLGIALFASSLGLAPLGCETTATFYVEKEAFTDPNNFSERPDLKTRFEVQLKDDDLFGEP